MRNKNRENDMRAKDNRSYAELVNDIEVACNEIAESPLHSTQDDKRVVTLLTSCYWLFRLSKREYVPLNEWYEKHKKVERQSHAR